MHSVITRLEQYLENVPERIRTIATDKLIHKPSPEKWSKQEVMGHLVDSALYNIIRFTQAQYKPSPYIVEGYAQDDLVRVNDYQNMSLAHIMEAWQMLNKHIVFILSKLSDAQSALPIIRNGEPITLGWLAEDYLNHMEHHLEQIFENKSI